MLIKSFPKINLCLLIGKKRNDKHKIKSIFYRIDSIWDEILIQKNEIGIDEITYHDKNNKLIDVTNCILHKTLSFLREKQILKKIFFKINVKKNIPMAAGLGGGSSNAGALINFLVMHNFLQKKISKKLIVNIGSDVMFFVKNFKIAKVYGFGEKVKELKTNNLFDVELIDTKIKCSTKEIFEIYDGLGNKPKNKFNNQLKYFKNKKYNLLVNELESCIYKFSPELEKKVLNLGKETKVFISGSGGTCFKIKEK